MKIHKNIRPIVITLIAIGFFALLKLQFPIFRVSSTSMPIEFKTGSYLMTSKLHKCTFNDVVVFNHNGKLHLSRIVGLSNDEVQGINGKLVRNGEALNTANVLNQYHLYAEPYGTIELTEIWHRELYPKREYLVLLTKKQASAISRKSGVNKLERIVHATAFNNDNAKEWTIDDFGPIRVPENCFFVVNDNRADVNDSRTLGMLPIDSIKGIVIAKL